MDVGAQDAAAEESMPLLGYVVSPCETVSLLCLLFHHSLLLLSC